MRRIFALLALAAFAGPALACDNSSELPKYKREFRSQYQDNGTPPSVSPDPYIKYALGGGGWALLMGAVVVTLRRSAS